MSISIEIPKDFYPAAVKAYNEIPIKYLRFQLHNGKYVSMLFKHKTPTTLSLLEKLSKLIKSKNNCRTCSKRAIELGCLTDIEGNSVYLTKEFCEKISIDDPHKHIYEEVSSICELITKEPITELYIVQGNVLCEFPEKQGGFSHFYKDIPEDMRTDPSITTDEITQINQMFHRYLFATDSHMFKMIAKITTPTVQSGLDSLNLMEQCLKDSIYGNILLHSTRWLKSIVERLQTIGKEWIHMTPREKWILCAEFLLQLKISKDDTGVVLLPYQTASNNVVDLLGSANSVPAMKKMVEQRMDPHNYQRRDQTKELSEGQIANAISKLGDFTNTIMTLEELPILVPESIMINSSSPSDDSSLSAFEKMRLSSKKAEVESGKGKAAAAGGFASRAGVSSLDTQIKDIKTITNLVKFLRENLSHIKKMQIYNSGFHTSYIAKTTLSQEALTVPYMWSFQLGYTNSEWKDVVAVIPSYETIKIYKIVHFILKDSRYKIAINCCFPVFLSSEYRRTCGPAFEKLNKEMPITIPEGAIACGVGTNTQTESNNLPSPIKLKINEIEISINSL
jgi:hypothetical protein